MVVEQQSAAADAERKAQLEALVSALQCQSNEEQRLAARLWQVGLGFYSTTLAGEASCKHPPSRLLKVRMGFVAHHSCMRPAHGGPFCS